MSRRQCGGLGRGLLWASLALASLSACPAPTTTTTTTTRLQVEGGSDAEKRFTEEAPLGDPPKIDPATPAADYLVEIAEVIQPAWGSFLEDCRLRLPPDHELNTTSLVVVLDIVLSNSGQVLGVSTQASSSNEAFDTAAIEIAGDLGSLPKPPAQWLSDDDRVHLSWSFARDIRQAGPATARLQRVELPLEKAIPKLVAAGQIAPAALRLLKAAEAGTIPEAFAAQVAEGALERAIAGGEAATVALAMRTIGEARIARLVSHVRAALGSTELPVAVAAAEALAQLGGKDDIALLETLARGESGSRPALSAAAAESLASLGRRDEVARTALVALSAGEELARAAAIAVFSVIESSDSVPLLSTILSDRSSPRVQRVAAAEALGKQARSDSRAVRALMTGTAAGDASVRAACVDAMASAARAGLRSRTSYWKIVSLLKDKDERVRASAIRAAAALDARRFAKELGAVKAGGSTIVLLSFAEALGAVPGKLALDRLLDLAAVDHVGMRAAAAAGLVNRQDENKAALALKGLLADEAPQVRLAALPALKTEAELRPFLSDASPAIQAAAMEALVALVGRAGTANTVAEKLAEAGDETAAQALWASAWLRGK